MRRYDGICPRCNIAPRSKQWGYAYCNPCLSAKALEQRAKKPGLYNQRQNERRRAAREELKRAALDSQGLVESYEQRPRGNEQQAYV